MARPRRSTKHSLKEQLNAEPYRFSFVQAVRLVQQAAAEQESPAESVGFDTLPAQECVRLASHSGRSFSPSEVVSLDEAGKADKPSSSRAPKLTVAFMGLFGPSGVLPHHDTQRIIDAGTKKTPERDFLDVFNHRILSLFYRASIKYRIPFVYEAAYRSRAPAEDVVTRALYSLAGMGTDGLRGRLEVRDELAIEFSGMFGHQPKNAHSLQRAVQSYFELPITIKQFVGQWMTLSDENKSEMPSAQMPLGQNCALGTTFILGERVWDVAGKFRFEIGPLNRTQFDSFLPGSKNLVEIAQIAQLYAGNQFDFDIQLALLAKDVPEIQLGQHSRLGLNTWLLSEHPKDDKSDAVFVQTGLPLSGGLGSAA